MRTLLSHYKIMGCIIKIYFMSRQQVSLSRILHELGWLSLAQWRVYVDIHLAFLYMVIPHLVEVDLSNDLSWRTKPSRNKNSQDYCVPTEVRTYIKMSFLSPPYLKNEMFCCFSPLAAPDSPARHLHGRCL